MKKIFLPLAIILSLLYYSCTGENCDQETEVYMKAAFYSAESSEPISIDSLDIYGLYIPDSSICSMATLEKVNLPLNPSASSCAFVIMNGGRSDTIEISYQSDLQFLSQACGYIFVFEIEEVLFTTNDILNVLITNKPVNQGDEENIQIFF